ncbi:hypothetical protein DFJ74DRAFT_396311 [Hyaloraphidium curvatum]|nr:hypothetical protein DFJ74DRAFT_396311 [Hyaloraphidium curvatum]
MASPLLPPQPKNVVHELGAIKKQLELLQESLAALYNVPAQANWPEVLSRFQILNIRYGQVLDEISRSSVANYVAFPFGLPEDPEFIPRVLLRTKLIPEIEAEQQKIWEKAKKDLDESGADVKELVRRHDEVAKAAASFVRKYTRYDDAGEDYRQELTGRTTPPPALAKMRKLDPHVAKKDLEAILRFQSQNVFGPPRR